MDKKNMEKIDILYDLVKKRNESLIERYNTINESLFTTDMKKIMAVLMDHYNKKILLSNEVSLQFADYKDSHREIEYYLTYYVRGSEKRLIPFNLPENKGYSDSLIQTLEIRVKETKEIDTRLTFIENHMEEFVEKIGEYYKKYVEKESDKLDELLAEMDYEQTSTKHLKITVEWI